MLRAALEGGYEETLTGILAADYAVALQQYLEQHGKWDEIRTNVSDTSEA